MWISCWLEDTASSVKAPICCFSVSSLLCASVFHHRRSSRAEIIWAASFLFCSITLKSDVLHIFMSQTVFDKIRLRQDQLCDYENIISECLSWSLAGVPVSFTRGHHTPDSWHFTQDSISHNPLHRLVNCITCLSFNLIISSQLSHVRRSSTHSLSSLVIKCWIGLTWSHCFLAFVFWSLDRFLVYDCFVTCPDPWWLSGLFSWFAPAVVVCCCCLLLSWIWMLWVLAHMNSTVKSVCIDVLPVRSQDSVLSQQWQTGKLGGGGLGKSVGNIQYFSNSVWCH